ncbi:MAG: hypothetical protein JST55_17175 [Bacteroidetes bacterium]|nr:hypothetical protein [Bacteroidota bacterium]
MAIIKYKNLTELSFVTWMNNYPQTWHPSDMERFYIFARTVVRYRSTRWENPNFLRTKILAHTPNFNLDTLDSLLDLYYHLIRVLKSH